MSTRVEPKLAIIKIVPREKNKNKKQGRFWLGKKWESTQAALWIFQSILLMRKEKDDKTITQNADSGKFTNMMEKLSLLFWLDHV